MQLTKVRIRGLKSIDSLNIELENGVTLLYGPNGIGKSTALEVMSLLGHLHHLTVLQLANGVFSIASEEAGAIHMLPKLRSSGANWSSLEAWFEAPKPGGCAAFTLRENSIQGGKPITLFVYFDISRDSTAGHATPSLTSLLSRAFTDADTKKYVALVVDPSTEEQTRSMMELTSRAVDRPRRSGGLLISYINTDLNDFGRGNDLRESPKDLAKDFVGEIKGRLQLPFTGNGGALQKLAELNAIFKSVLKYPALYVPGMTSSDTAFKISACSIDPVTSKLTFTATRLADNRDHATLDFLSAGENECFFVFALLLHLPLRSGLVLLDEPDLHVGPHQKRDFFAALYAAIEEAGCQAVIATHSEYALAGFANVGYAVIRPIVERDGRDFRFHYVANDDIDLRLAHTKLLLSRSFHSLKHTGLFSKKLLGELFKNFKILRAQVFFFVNLGAIIILLILLSLSAFSDVLLSVFHQSNEAHDKFAKAVVALLIPALVTFVGFVFWVYFETTSERRKQRKLLKQALAAKSKRLNSKEQG